jgi:hypothetical protein
MVKRKSLQSLKKRPTYVLNGFEHIGQNGTYVIKSFLDVYSKLCFIKSSKQYYKPDQDIVTFMDLLNTRLFNHSNNRDFFIEFKPHTQLPQIQDMNQVIKTLIQIFTNSIVVTEENMTMPKPFVSVRSDMDDQGHELVDSRDGFDFQGVLEFDYSSTIWEKLFFAWDKFDLESRFNEWNDEDGINSLHVVFQGYPMSTRCASDDQKSGFFHSGEGWAEFTIENPRFCVEDFRREYPNGCT